MIPLDPDTFVTRFPRLCTALTLDEVDLLLRSLDVQELSAGEALIAEGTTADGLFLVWDGELDVFLDTPDGDQEIARVGPGAFLGEVSLLSPGRATATVLAEQGCVALRLTRQSFEELCTSNASLAAPLLHELCRTLASRIEGAAARLDTFVQGGGDASAPFPPTATTDLLTVHASLYEEGR